MTGKPLNILLADDDLDDRNFFKDALNALPLKTQLETVNDGDELMKYSSENVHQLPDVLFLDINMPRKNGFECLSEIKLNPDLHALRVIIFSTSYVQEVVNLLYINGAQYFMRKRAEFAQLKRIIQQTVALISKGDATQPSREHFVLTVQK
jgi:CheY-like chemotaxis protein